MFFPRGGSAQVVRYLARAIAEGPSGWQHARRERVARRAGRPRATRPRSSPGSTWCRCPTTRRSRRPTRCWPRRRSTPPTRTGRGRPTGSSRARRRRLRAPGRRVVARPGGARGARRRRGGPPAPPDAGPRGHGAAAAGHAGGDPPARHRAADARPGRDRGASGPTRRVAARACARGRRVGPRDRVVGALQASTPATCWASTRARVAVVPERHRPRRCSTGRRADPRGARGRSGAAGWCDEPARLVARRPRARAACATPASRSRRCSTRRPPSCSSSGASPPSSARPCWCAPTPGRGSGWAAPLPLVLWGGFPGEWEGEHPADAAARSPWGHEVFLAGWRSHDELPGVLAAADVMAVPSVAERFGQVYVEAMAMRVPLDRLPGGRPAHLHRRRPRLAGPLRVAGAARRRGGPGATRWWRRPPIPAERARRGATGRGARASASRGPASPGAVAERLRGGRRGLSRGADEARRRWAGGGRRDVDARRPRGAGCAAARRPPARSTRRRRG